MKRAINFLGAISLVIILMAACGQNTRTDTRDNLTDVREDMREVIQNIDEALATDDVSNFKSKTEDAVSSLDNKIDDYLSEMDNADRRIDHNSRNQIIEIKQKNVEIEFKLALLEQEDYDNWGDRDRQQDRTGTTTDMRTGDDRTATGARQTTTDDKNHRREILYGQQLVDDLKADLRDLRGKVEQFVQSNLAHTP